MCSGISGRTMGNNTVGAYNGIGASGGASLSDEREDLAVDDDATDWTDFLKELEKASKEMNEALAQQAEAQEDTK